MSFDFSEWKMQEIHKGEGKIFIKDGIIDPEKWNKAPVKILFLLKEAYEKQDKREDQDYCQWVRNLKSLVGLNNTWRRMSEWTYGIFNLKEKGRISPFPESNKDYDFHETDSIEYLKSVAVVNIKKSNGKTYSSQEDLLEYIESDWDFIQKQIDHINPDLIICGNVLDLIWAKLGPSDDEKKALSEWVYSIKGKIFVDFWHPGNQVHKKMIYYALCSALEISGYVEQECYGDKQ